MTPQVLEDKFLTMQEVAHMLSLGEGQVATLIERGDLAQVSFLGETRIAASAVRDWIAGVMEAERQVLLKRTLDNPCALQTLFAQTLNEEGGSLQEALLEIDAEDGSFGALLQAAAQQNEAAGDVSSKGTNIIRFTRPA